MNKDVTSLSLLSSLPADWEERLVYLKLKCALSALSDTRSEILAQEYFIVFASGMTEAYLKEILTAHRQTREHKHTKAMLVIVCDPGTSEKMQNICQEIHDAAAVVVSSLSEKEIAVLLRGAIALLAPLFTVSQRALLLDTLHFGVPAVVTNNNDVRALVGHAAYFLERVDVEELQRALLKLENSSQLRSSIQHAAREYLAQHVIDY